MPELPEVETVRKSLEKRLKNKRILDINIIYKPIFEGQDIDFIKKNIAHQTIKSMERKGKWLIFCLDDYYLLSHLRMEGKYIYRDIGSRLEKHEHVIFNIDNEFELRYKDVRKFGRMYFVKKEDLFNTPLKDLGFEPWDKDLTSSYLKDKYKQKSIPIKTVLLDQSIITGIGNIYADEILFLSKINPYEKPCMLKKKDLDGIIENTRLVLDKAIMEGGTTIRSYTSEEGVIGKNQNNLLVHMREGEKCKECGTVIKRDKINGRSSYYCAKCQKKRYE